MSTLDLASMYIYATVLELRSHLKILDTYLGSYFIYLLFDMSHCTEQIKIKNKCIEYLR